MFFISVQELTYKKKLHACELTLTRKRAKEHKNLAWALFTLVRKEHAFTRALAWQFFFCNTLSQETTSKPVMILPQVHLRKPCYDFYFL